MKLPSWKRAGPDGEIEIKFPTGRRFKIEKQYDSNIRHKGEWKVMEWDPRTKDWEWGDTYSPKAYAKQKAMEVGQYDKRGKKVADYSSTFQYESVNEDIKPQYVESLWSNIAAKRARGEKMRKKGDKGAPTPDQMKRAQAASEDTTTASIPNPADTAMGPRVKEIPVTDRRRKKDKHPVLLKRFREVYKEL